MRHCVVRCRCLSWLGAVFLLTSVNSSVVAFSTSQAHGIKRRRCPSCVVLLSHPSKETSRRSFWSRSGLSVLATLVGASSITPEAQAKDELFKSNPLTNPALQQIRIWEQAEADELRYGGELAMGNEGNRGKTEMYPKLLVPILQIASQLEQVQTLLHDTSDNAQSWKRAQDILNQPKYEKVAFKKIFNRYGDNIYYSDPDRANLYLGGGATPRSEQSLAYLLRNDILTNVESLKAEIDYLLLDSTSPEEKMDTQDLFLYAKTCTDAMKRYLDLVPPKELETARKAMLAASASKS